MIFQFYRKYFFILITIIFFTHIHTSQSQNPSMQLSKDQERILTEESEKQLFLSLRYYNKNNQLDDFIKEELYTAKTPEESKEKLNKTALKLIQIYAKFNTLDDKRSTLMIEQAIGFICYELYKRQPEKKQNIIKEKIKKSSENLFDFRPFNNLINEYEKILKSSSKSNIKKNVSHVKKAILLTFNNLYEELKRSHNFDSSIKQKNEKLRESENPSLPNIDLSSSSTKLLELNQQQKTTWNELQVIKNDRTSIDEFLEEKIKASNDLFGLDNYLDDLLEINTKIYASSMISEEIYNTQKLIEHIASRFLLKKYKNLSIPNQKLLYERKNNFFEHKPFSDFIKKYRNNLTNKNLSSKTVDLVVNNLKSKASDYILVEEQRIKKEKLFKYSDNTSTKTQSYVKWLLFGVGLLGAGIFGYKYYQKKNQR